MTTIEEQVFLASRDHVESVLGKLDNSFTPKRHATAYLEQICYKGVFMPRGQAEECPLSKQLIPYILVTYQGKVLAYYRKGTEQRLSGQMSIGIGGHVNPCDTEALVHLTPQWVLNGWEQFKASRPAYNAAAREIFEEIGNVNIDRITLLGFLNDDANPVGQVHLGLVFHCELKDLEGVEFEDALHDPQWLDPMDLCTGFYPELETWSQMVLNVIGVQLIEARAKVVDAEDDLNEPLGKPYCGLDEECTSCQ